MDIYKIIFENCRHIGISVRELERRCVFPQGTIKRWSNITPGIDKVERLRMCSAARSMNYADARRSKTPRSSSMPPVN